MYNQCILLRAVVTGGSERAKGGKSQTEWLEASLFGELGVAKKKMKITFANVTYILLQNARAGGGVLAASTTW